MTLEHFILEIIWQARLKSDVFYVPGEAVFGMYLDSLRYPV